MAGRPLANSIAWVAAAHSLDRFGKGVRGAPRDALVTDLTPPDKRGAAFGLRQSLDSLGSLSGPLLALGLMWLRMGTVAAATLAAGTSDPAFYEAKLVSANYYAERFLPDAGALRRKLEAGSEYMMKLPAEAFATAA